MPTNEESDQELEDFAQLLGAGSTQDIRDEYDKD